MSGDLYPSLPPDRGEAVRAWLSSPIGTCRVCGEPIYPTDPRARDPDEKDKDAATLVHLLCLSAAESEADE
jgi:hypothetical protein